MTDREQNILNMFISTVQFDAENSNDYKSLPDAAANFAIVRAAVAALETYSAAQVSGAFLNLTNALKFENGENYECCRN